VRQVALILLAFVVLVGCSGQRCDPGPILDAVNAYTDELLDPTSTLNTTGRFSLGTWFGYPIYIPRIGG
jgi:hypothetical protein